MVFRKPRGLKVIDLIEEHVTLCTKAVNMIADIIKMKFTKEERTNGNNINKLINELYEIEKRADNIRRSIANELAKDILPPLSREDLIRLIERLDLVADCSKDAGRLISILKDVSGVSSDFTKLLINMSNKVVECAVSLKECMNTLMKDIKSAIKQSYKVEQIEEEVDELYILCLRELYGSRITCPEVFILAEIVKMLEEIADFCEDVSDLVKVIAIRGSI